MTRDQSQIESEWAHVGRELLLSELERVSIVTRDALTEAATRINTDGELSESEVCQLHVASDQMSDVVDMADRVVGEIECDQELNSTSY